MFDCVMPTRSGRHGQAFTWGGKVNLKNARHADDRGPARSDEQLPRRARLFSRAYLHHLVKSREYLGAMLLSWANVAFYQELMAAMRAAIAEGTLRRVGGGDQGAARCGGVRPLTSTSDRDAPSAWGLTQCASAIACGASAARRIMAR